MNSSSSDNDLDELVLAAEVSEAVTGRGENRGRPQRSSADDANNEDSSNTGRVVAEDSS